MENEKNAKKTDVKHGVFNKFFLVQIGVGSTAGAKQQKMWMLPRVPNGQKKRLFLDFAVLWGWADSILDHGVSFIISVSGHKIPVS